MPNHHLRLERRIRPRAIPLSYQQQRLWFIDQLHGCSAEYNMIRAHRLRGPLDVGALRQALQAVIARHEVLRTRFLQEDGTPRQDVRPVLTVPLDVEDIRDLAPADREARIRHEMRAAATQRFDLTADPLIRMRVLRLDAAEHVVIRTMHHIVSDRWSQQVFNTDLAALYQICRRDRRAAPAALPVQYADFAMWQREWLDATDTDSDLAHWTASLRGFTTPLQIPSDRARSTRRTTIARRITQSLDSATVAALKRTAAQRATTLCAALLTGYAVLLHRYTDQDRVVIGLPVANRRARELRSLVGFFVNILPLPISVAPSMRLCDVLECVRAVMVEGLVRQHVPFERIVEALRIPRSAGVMPLLSTTFTLQEPARGAWTFAGLEAGALMADVFHTHTDLELHAQERNDRLVIEWRYDPQLFDEWRIEQMARHFQRVLETLVADRECRIDHVEWLDADERQRLCRDEQPSGRHQP